jgi:hypothetical protein
MNLIVDALLSKLFPPYCRFLFLGTSAGLL